MLSLLPVHRTNIFSFSACVASSLTIYFKYKFAANPLDVTYEAMPIILSSLVEMCVGVTASCMPAMSHLLRHSISLSWISTKLTSIFSLSSQGRKSGCRREPTGHTTVDHSSTSSHPHPRKFYHKPSSSDDATLTSSAPYTNIDSSTMMAKKQGMVEMAPVVGTRTYIRTSETDSLEDADLEETRESARRIHLRYRLEDSSSIPITESRIF